MQGIKLLLRFPVQAFSFNSLFFDSSVTHIPTLIISTGRQRVITDKELSNPCQENQTTIFIIYGSNLSFS